MYTLLLIILTKYIYIIFKWYNKAITLILKIKLHETKYNIQQNNDE